MFSMKFQSKLLYTAMPLTGLILVGMSLQSCGKREAPTTEKPYEVTKGDVAVSIIETGTVDAVRTVEIKPQVTGRLAELFVDEGSMVVAGQLLAVIDPQETQLRVEQGRAQLMGAQSVVERSSLEIDQRRKTAKAALAQAEARVKQLELEIANQPSLLQADVKQAEAALASAEQDRDRLVKSSQPTQKVSTLASLNEAEQNLKNAKLEVERQRDLERKGFVSLRAVQTAELNVGVAEARYRTARESFSRLEAGLNAELQRSEEAVKTARAQVQRARANLFQLGTRKEDLASAKAEVERAKASLTDPALLEKTKQQGQATVMQLSSALRDQERQLNETKVKSPISGIVTKRVLQVGELATGLSQFGAGSTILKIEDRTKMRVKLAVNEIDVARLSIGMKAEVMVDALQGQKFSGTISKIAPARQEAAGQTVQVGTDSVVKYEVEIVLDESSKSLKSGMSAKCTMNADKRTNVVYLPVEYTEKKDGAYFAAFPPKDLKDPNATKQRIPLKVGLVTASRVEIVSGVKVGDKVVKPDFSGPKRKGFMQMGPDDESNDTNGEKK